MSDSASKSADTQYATATRSKTEIWLVGQAEEKIPRNVLPASGDVLKTFFYHHHVCKKTVTESAKCTSEEVMRIWNNARIPTTYQPHVVAKLKALVEEYGLIKKNKNRKTEAQHSRQKEFAEQLTKLFDIAHKNADSLLKIDDDRIFLEDQRTNRKMKMSVVDVALTKKEECVQQRKQIEEERKRREEIRKEENELNACSSHKCVLPEDSDEDSDTEQQDTEDSDYEVEIPVYHRKQLVEDVGECSQTSHNKKPRIVPDMLSSPDVSSVLDRINLSDRKFTVLAAAIAKASGEDLGSTVLSRSTVRRKRVHHRSVIESQVRKEFQTGEKPPLLVHWDGKVMKDSTNLEDQRSSTDRLAVVVSGRDVEKILGIMKMPSGTGQAQAKATFQLLNLWDISGDIVGMCFDTTASNTGRLSGACVVLEKLMDRNLMYFACRHHVHEIIIGEVYTVLLGPSRGPNIALFERFRKFWPNIDQSHYRPLEDSRLNNPFLQQLKEQTVSFLQHLLTADSSYLPREDYRELIELCILVLGGSLPSETHCRFRLPGAYHMARWMAKVIYCQKIYLFRDQFKLTASEARHLTEFCLFAAHIYVQAWITCPLASDAPVNDWLLFNRIKQYAAINQAVSHAAMTKLQNHLWYLGAEMVPFVLFSDKISVDDKRLVAQAMANSGAEWTVRGVRYPSEECDQLQTKKWHELITSSSTAAMNSLGLDVSTLAANDPHIWKDIPSFQQAAAVVKSIKVVNDVAERSVALMSSFNQSITRRESGMQKLIQVVEDNRRRIPDASKSTLESYSAR